MLESTENLKRIIDAEEAIGKACVKIFTGKSLSKKEFEDSVGINYAKIGIAIGNELGIPVLESQLRDFAQRSL